MDISDHPFTEQHRQSESMKTGNGLLERLASSDASPTTRTTEATRTKDLTRGSSSSALNSSAAEHLQTSNMEYLAEDTESLSVIEDNRRPRADSAKNHTSDRDTFDDTNPVTSPSAQAEVVPRRKDSNRDRLRVTFSDECSDITTPLTSPPHAGARTCFASSKDRQASSDSVFLPGEDSSIKQVNGYKLPKPPIVSSRKVSLSVPPASSTSDINEPELDAEELARMRQNFCPMPGKKYLVQMQSAGEQHVAELLSKRMRQPNNAVGATALTAAVMLDGKNTALPDEVGGVDNNNVEYFVHFEGFNRRLDEWVTIDRIHPRELDQNQLSAKADENDARKRTRSQKRRHDEINHIAPTLAEIDPSQAALEKLHEEVTKIKYIDKIVFGPYEIDTWYYSPYPGEYRQLPVLYVCEYCMKYMKKRTTWEQHKRECIFRQPPGREIYRKGQLSVYEADGARYKVYCQCLCLLAKLFLDHKTLYFDVEPFWFYILTEYDQQGAHVVGYFSKEKESADGNNVACILTFPPFQRKGYGKFLIDLSYELSRREHKVGSPEKPLSDMGKLSYRSYWAYSILSYLRNIKDRDLSNLSIRDLSNEIGFHCGDIINTLQPLNLVRYWRSHYVLTCKHDVICEYLEKSSFRPPRLTVDKSCLRWQPHLPVAPRAIERITMLKAALGEQHLVELMNHMTLLKTGVAPPAITTTTSPKSSPSGFIASPPQTQSFNGTVSTQSNAETSSIAATANTVLQQLQSRMSSGNNKAFDKALLTVCETWRQACENVRRYRENGNIHSQLGLGTAQPEVDVNSFSSGANSNSAENDGGSVDGSVSSSSGGSGSTNSGGYNPQRPKAAASSQSATFTNVSTAAHTSTLSQTATDTLAATRTRRILKPSAVVRDNAATSIDKPFKPRGRKPQHSLLPPALLQQQQPAARNGGRKRAREVSSGSIESIHELSDESDQEMPDVKTEDFVAYSFAGTGVSGGGKAILQTEVADDSVPEDLTNSLSTFSSTGENEPDGGFDANEIFDHQPKKSNKPTNVNRDIVDSEVRRISDILAKPEETVAKPRRSARLVPAADEVSVPVAADSKTSMPVSPANVYNDDSADVSVAASTSNEQSLNGDQDDPPPVKRGKGRPPLRLKTVKLAPVKRSAASSGTEVDSDAGKSKSTTKSGKKKSKHLDNIDAFVDATTDESAKKHHGISSAKPAQAMNVFSGPFSGSVFEELNSPSTHMSDATSLLPPLTSITQIVDGNVAAVDDDNWNNVTAPPTATASRTSYDSAALSLSVISSFNDDKVKNSLSSSSSLVDVPTPATRIVTIIEPKLHLPTSTFATSTTVTSTTSNNSSAITRLSLRRNSSNYAGSGAGIAPAKQVASGKKASSARREQPLTMMTRKLRSSQAAQLVNPDAAPANSSVSSDTIEIIDEADEDVGAPRAMLTRRRKSLTAGFASLADSKTHSAALSTSASSTDLSNDGSARKLKHVTLINPDSLQEDYKSPSSSAVMSPATSVNCHVFSPSAARATATAPSSFFSAAQDPYVIADEDEADDNGEPIPSAAVLYAADAEIDMNPSSNADAVANDQSWPSHFDAGSPPIIVANRGAADYITMPQICGIGRSHTSMPSTNYHERSSVDRSGADITHMGGSTSNTDIASKSLLMNILGDSDDAMEMMRPASGQADGESGPNLYASSSFEFADDDGGSFSGRKSRKQHGKSGRKSKMHGNKNKSKESSAVKNYNLTDEQRELKRSRAVSMVRNEQGRFVKVADSANTSSANSESGAPPVLSLTVPPVVEESSSVVVVSEKQRGMTPSSAASGKKTAMSNSNSSGRKTPAPKSHAKKSGTPTSSGKRAPSSSSTGVRRSGGSERESLRSSPSPPSPTDQLTIDRLNAVDAVTASRPRDRPMRASAKGALLSFVTRDL